jgi:hypothetical protein
MMLTMSSEADDCRNCGKENATILIWPENNDHDYNKVCSDNCYTALGEAYDEERYTW